MALVGLVVAPLAPIGRCGTGKTRGYYHAASGYALRAISGAATVSWSRCWAGLQSNGGQFIDDASVFVSSVFLAKSLKPNNCLVEFGNLSLDSRFLIILWS
jgi:hypothetical protein